MIRLVGVSKIYRLGEVEVPALQQISLEIESGSFVSIMGPSGSGKSTLMNIIGCLDRPSSGSYILNGEDVSQKSDNSLAEIRNKYIGFVFQNFNLLPRLNALENVELPLVYRGVSRIERRKAAEEALKRVGIGQRLRHKPSELSGGQQQRVAIARALVGRPALILADEPTGNLDSRSGLEIMGLFQELNRQGITVVLVTHDEQVARFSRRIVRLRDGVIVADEPVKQQFVQSAASVGDREVVAP